MSKSTLFEKKITRDISNKELILLSLLPAFCVAKLIVHYLLPDKYFFDSQTILSMMDNATSYSYDDGSYETAAKIFSSINFLGVEFLWQWQIILGLLYTVILGLVVLGLDEPNIAEAIYIVATVVLAQIYVFSLTKEIIQFSIFCIIVVVIHIPWKPIVKLSVVASILVMEGQFFRQYYFITAILFLFVFAVISMASKRFGKKSVGALYVVVFLILGMIIFLCLIDAIFPSLYLDISTARLNSNINRVDSTNARTMIIDLLGSSNSNSNLFVFCGNYIINCVRLLFPIELLTKGIYYIPFLMFQFATSFFLFRAINLQISNYSITRVITLSVFIAFVMTSVLFEPDFGSWVRHEISSLPILLFFVVCPVSNPEDNLWGLNSGYISSIAIS